jgi:hypothetical protein
MIQLLSLLFVIFSSQSLAAAPCTVRAEVSQYYSMKTLRFLAYTLTDRHYDLVNEPGIETAFHLKLAFTGVESGDLNTRQVGILLSDKSGQTLLDKTLPAPEVENDRNMKARFLINQIPICPNPKAL